MLAVIETRVATVTGKEEGQGEVLSTTVELTSGCVLDGIHSTVHTDPTCCSPGHYKELAESGSGRQPHRRLSAESWKRTR